MTLPLHILFALCVLCGLAGFVIGFLLGIDKSDKPRPAARIDYSAIELAERN